MKSGQSVGFLRFDPIMTEGEFSLKSVQFTRDNKSEENLGAVIRAELRQRNLGSSGALLANRNAGRYSAP